VIDGAVWGVGTAGAWIVDEVGELGTWARGNYPTPADYSGDGNADPAIFTVEDGYPIPNDWTIPVGDIQSITLPNGAWPANIAPWLVRYIVPLTWLDQCIRFNPGRCGFTI
jgi:hypothetical protein